MEKKILSKRDVQDQHKLSQLVLLLVSLLLSLLHLHPKDLQLVYFSRSQSVLLVLLSLRLTNTII